MPELFAPLVMASCLMALTALARVLNLVPLLVPVMAQRMALVQASIGFSAIADN
jgi:hypothetical protein